MGIRAAVDAWASGSGKPKLLVGEPLGRAVTEVFDDVQFFFFFFWGGGQGMVLIMCFDTF